MKIRAYAFTLLLSCAVLLSACSLRTAEDNATPEPLPGSGSDPCLQGNWLMSNEDVNSLMQDLVPVPGLSAPSGTLTMAFTGSDFSYASSGLVVRMDNPGGYMEAEAAFLVTSSFSTQDGIVNFANTVYDSEILVWRAVINGETTEAAGPATLQFPVPGSGPYGCTADTLTFEVAGSGGPVVMMFTRQP